MKNPNQQQLNKLLEYFNNKQYDDAEKVGLSLTKQFPKHQFSWKILGAIFQLNGKITKSLAAMQKSVELEPNDPGAHNNLASTLKKLGRLEDAEASYRKAIALKLDYFEAYCSLANTLKELRRFVEAEASFRQAIAIKPDFFEAHFNLGNTLVELGTLEKSEASFRQAIELRPNFPEAHNNLGSTLKSLGRLDEAMASFRQAIAIKPDFFEAHHNLGKTLKGLGRLDEAEASFAQTIVLKPNFAEAHHNLGNTLKGLGRLDEAEASFAQTIVLNPKNFKAHEELLRCLYEQDKKSVFFDELDYLINQDKANAVIGSLICRSKLKYGLERPNLFCKEPLNYVLHIDLNTRCDFEKIFVEKAKSIINDNQISRRTQALLTNGYQTSGNLFDIKNDYTNEIQKLIRSEIEKYRINFKESEDGLIKKWPTDYSLYGWLINMKSGGELKPHIHSEGWLSGSVYINVPRKSKSNSGNLVVSLGEEKDVIDKSINMKKIINVVTGSMVLFPASLMHHTIPFESEEERTVIAFDVKQK